MCGIAAIISTDYIDKIMVEGMLDSIIHRGPDDGGIISLSSGRVILGHRRLSIIDISAYGRQPMKYMGGQYTISYNGEIYNYIELRRTLIEKGYTFKTNTDTEVIMAAYDFWGEECLNHFNGMWGFVLYDRDRNEVFLSRDRFGVKPLYYWHSPYGFVAFASEIKEFYKLPGWTGKINSQKCYDYLAYGITDHTDETMYEGVRQIRGGEYAVFSVNEKMSEKHIHCWYNLRDDKFTGTLEEASDIFRELFFDAIKLRLRSDAPIGSCLSGGLDSSSIVCTINEIINDLNVTIEQKTVSAGANDKRYDEMNYVQMIFDERPNIDGKKVYPDINKLFDDLPQLLYHQDEPFGSTSIYASWCVFNTAQRSGLKVMLDGQGADEILAGYDGFYQVRFASLIRKLKFIQLAKEVKDSYNLRNIHYLTCLKAFVKAFIGQNEARYGALLKSKNKKTWLSAEKLNVSNYGGDGFKFNTDVHAEQRQRLYRCNLPQLLHYEDRNTMAFSIEGRLPFLDYRLVEFVLSLPEEYCISDGITKRVLRNSMSGILPNGIRDRMSKLGFVTPEALWLKSNTRLFRERIQETVESTDGIITSQAIKLLDDMVDDKIPFDFSVWRIICFGEWMKKMAC